MYDRSTDGTTEGDNILISIDNIFANNDFISGNYVNVTDAPTFNRHVALY